jgi:glycosyltransferase involved in cell wall biosynthesis
LKKLLIKSLKPEKYENKIIAVDDCSVDKSSEILKKMLKEKRLIIS